MNQFYLNRPSVGTAISAEEFTAGTCQCPKPFPPPAPEHGCGCEVPCASIPPVGCGCGGAASDCLSGDCEPNGACGQQMICCCRPAPAPAPQPPQVEEGCCCKQSFRAALSLLCDQQISSLLDFDAAAFVTGAYVAGAALSRGKPFTSKDAEPQADANTGTMAKPVPPTPPNPNEPSDNLGVLSGSFRRFAPCTCDLLDISAKLCTPDGKRSGFTAVQASLCQLDAVVIQGAAAAAEGDLTAAETAARNFRCIRQRLAQRLNPCGDPCGQAQCSCACDGRDCCCAAGLLSTLAQNNLSRRVSLAAGLLVLQNTTLLGAVGNVLVLSNDTDNRLYFVCVNSVQFIG